MARPAPMPFLGNTGAQRAYKDMKLDEIRDQRDISEAERAARLHALFNSDVWVKDILPILRDTYDAYLDRVKAHEVNPDTLKVLDDLIQRLGGSLQLGIGAMERIAKRRLSAAEKIEAQKSDSVY